MKIKCYSVRILEILTVSEKALEITDFNGNIAIIPKSQVFGRDAEPQKAISYWISAWILERKNIKYSTKKQAWFDSETRRRLPNYKIKKHVPDKVNKKVIHDKKLKR